MATKQFLALLEVDKIHNYIFATNKLKEIRGASYLLSAINEPETEQVLESYSTAKKILSTGGVTKVIFDDKDQAHNFLKQMEGIYQRKLITASVTTHVEPINHDFCSAIGKGELAIRRKKEDKDYIFQVNTSGYYKICSLCGQYPAKETESTQEGILWLCASCKQKRTYSHCFLRIHDRIDNKIKESRPMVDEVKFPEQFEDIGKESRVEGYMGYVVADGNRMGEKIKLSEVSSNPDVYHNFSKKVKESTDEALVEAVIESVPKTFDERDNSVFLPVLVLILGGDDMILVTTAESALPLAVKFSQKFQQKTKGLPEISMSVGVVISKISFPIFSYAKLGEELLKSAKRLSRVRSKDGKEVGAIDFMVVTSPSTQSLEEVRKDTFYYKKKDTDERFWLTARPYTTTESDYDFNLEKLLNFTRQFKNGDFPRTKLKAMERYLRMGRENSTLEFCTMKLRLKETHRKLLDEFISSFKLHDKLHEQMPWRIEEDNMGKYFLTNLLDLVEIHEFVQGRRSDAG